MPSNQQDIVAWSIDQARLIRAGRFGENTNGLLRQYLPKGMDLSGLSQRHLTMIAKRLNTRPRKCLGFRTPEEVLHEEINQLNAAVALQS